MGKDILMFGDIEVGKNKLYHHKILVPLRDVDIEKVLACKNISFDDKLTINTVLVTCMIIKLSHYT